MHEGALRFRFQGHLKKAATGEWLTFVWFEQDRVNVLH